MHIAPCPATVAAASVARAPVVPVPGAPGLLTHFLTPRMPLMTRVLTAVLLSGAAVCVAPQAVAQQYAVPAGEAIVLDGGGRSGGHVSPQMHTAYRSTVGGQSFSENGFVDGGFVDGGFVDGEVMDGSMMDLPVTGGPVVAESYPQVRSTQYPQGAYPQGGGGGYVFDEPSYAGPVVGESVCGAECGDAGGYGEIIYDSGSGYGGSGYSYGALGYGCDGGLCDGGLCDGVCGSCGTTGCTPGACDPTCKDELVCGGPVVCNKFGRCGKYYTNAVAQEACGVSAGYSFLFLRPNQGDATAAIRRNPVGAGGSNNVREEFDFSVDAGSRIFVEVIRPDALGARVTWSGLESNSDRLRFAGTARGVTSAALPASFAPVTNVPSGSLTAGLGDVLQVESEVQFSVFDLDATQRLRAGGWLLNTGGGVRFARLEQDYAARVTGRNGGFANGETTFSGVGPTGFAEARRPLGDTGFAFLKFRPPVAVGRRQREPRPRLAERRHHHRRRQSHRVRPGRRGADRRGVERLGQSGHPLLHPTGLRGPTVGEHRRPRGHRGEPGVHRVQPRRRFGVVIGVATDRRRRAGRHGAADEMPQSGPILKDRPALGRSCDPTS